MDGAKDDQKEAILSGLTAHIGTEKWFRHWSRRFTYTEGVRFLAEEAKAHWLIDLVASWCPHPALRGEEFIAWKLQVRPDRSAVATADDGNDRVLVTQEIPLTDFPLDEITLYITDNVLLLTSEY